jgi:hypothetical protein
MAQPLVIQIVRDPAYTADEMVVLTINGTVQPDRIRLWDDARRKMGEGFGGELSTGEGFGAWVPYGEGIEGYGWDGAGAGVLAHRTVRRFVAGDYEVTAKGVDLLGNDGTACPVLVVAHRPAPPAVTGVSVNGSTVNFNWSDV